MHAKSRGCRNPGPKKGNIPVQCTHYVTDDYAGGESQRLFYHSRPIGGSSSVVRPNPLVTVKARPSKQAINLGGILGPVGQYGNQGQVSFRLAGFYSLPFSFEELVKFEPIPG